MTMKNVLLSVTPLEAMDSGETIYKALERVRQRATPKIKCAWNAGQPRGVRRGYIMFRDVDARGNTHR
jgi:hypothetical protein